jgi:hypothetical protein
MNRFVVDPAHIDVLLSVAINGPSDQPDELPWHIPSAIEITGDLAPFNRRHADEVGAALLAMCIASVRHFDTLRKLPERLAPDPIPDPRQYQWTDLGSLLTTIEALVAISWHEGHSNHHPCWYLSPQYIFCNRLRSRLVASLPGCGDARLHWTTDAVVERVGPGLSLERVLGISEVVSDHVDDSPPTGP